MVVQLKQVIAAIKRHPVLTTVIFVLGSPVTAFSYAFIADLVDGRWTGGTEIYIHSEPLTGAEPVYLFYTSPRIPETFKIAVPVEVNVVNDSRKAAKNVTLSLRYPAASFLGAQYDDNTSFSGPHSAKDVWHDRNINAKYSYSNHRIILMTPKDNLDFVEGAYALPLGLDTPRFRTTGLGFDVQVSLSSETESARTKELRFRGVVADDNKGIATWLAQDYGRYVAMDLRNKDGLLQYLWGWITQRKITVYSFFTHYQLNVDGKLYVPMRNPEEYKKYKFSPYVKEFIFAG